MTTSAGGRPRKGVKPAAQQKQKLFVAEYLIDRNGTQAAIRAGYSKKSAGRTASMLLALPWVKSLVDAKTEERAANLEITAARVLQEYARIAFVPGDAAYSFGPGGVEVKDSTGLSADVLAAVAEVSETTTEAGGSIRVKMHSKTEALNALAKHLNLFPTQKLELSADDKLQRAIAALSAAANEPTDE